MLNILRKYKAKNILETKSHTYSAAILLICDMIQYIV